MAQVQVLNDPEDLQWFQDTHIKGSLPWLKAVILHGNEDFPDSAELFNGPSIEDHVMTIEFDGPAFGRSF